MFEGDAETKSCRAFSVGMHSKVQLAAKKPQIAQWRGNVIPALRGGKFERPPECYSTVIWSDKNHVAILDIDVTRGTTTETELSSKYGADRVKFYKCDITTNELTIAFDKVVETFGYIDVVVNCAGIMNDKIYEKSIAVNVTALVTSSFKAYELMRKDKGGKGGTIVNVASIAALAPSFLMPLYDATKSAVLTFSITLGQEPVYSRTGVRVINICFGATNTELIYTKPDVFDPVNKDFLEKAVADASVQSTDTAAKGLVEAYKQGSSASTWLVMSGRPAQDISDDITEAYNIMGRHLL